MDPGTALGTSLLSSRKIRTALSDSVIAKVVPACGAQMLAKDLKGLQALTGARTPARDAGDKTSI